MAKAKIVTHDVEGQSSILHNKFNLACLSGHRYFSPEPMEFVGRGCDKPNCNKKLVFLRNSREIPKPVKKSKLRKMKRF